MKLLMILSVFGLNGQVSWAEQDKFPLELGRVSVETLSRVYSQEMTAELRECASLLPKPASSVRVDVTEKEVKSFQREKGPGVVWAQAKCQNASEVKRVALDAMRSLGQNQVSLEKLASQMRSLSQKELEGLFPTGWVSDQRLTLRYLPLFARLKKESAIRRAKTPQGIQLDQLVRQLDAFGLARPVTYSFLDPVSIDPNLSSQEKILSSIESTFIPSGVELHSAGTKAVEAFWNASEAGGKDPRFAPIAELLKKPSIKNQFYFYGSGEYPFGWSAHILLVLDEHNQMYGLKMGYQE